MKTLIVVFAFLVPLCASAQPETLITGEIEHGGFGGPVVKVTRINGEDAVLVGGCGGWIINHTFIIGGGGYGLVTDVRSHTLGPNGERSIELGYGGVELEYIAASDKLIHMSFGMLIGGGGVAYKQPGEMDSSHRDMDGFFVVEPAVHLNLNVTSFLRIAAGVGYRYVSGVDAPVDAGGVARPLTSNADLRGVSGSMMLQFGKF